MPFDSAGTFYPSVFKKQAAVINDTHLYCCLSGPRFCGKTLGGLHALVWHLWKTKNAHVSVVGRSVTDNMDSGAWTDLLNIILPEWMDGGFLKFITEPRLSHATHKVFFEVNNAFGGKSVCQLDSLMVEDDAERKFKGKRFSMIYMTEGSNFKQRKTFDVLQECLRMKGLPEGQHRFLIDTNPADEGTDHWIYQLFWKQRLRSDWDGVPDDRKKAIQTFQRKLHVFEFTLDDNDFISEDQKTAQRAKYDHDPELYDRYVLGKWTKASMTSAFSDVLAPSRHFLGEDPETPNGEPAILLPEEKCSELFTGWDIGDVNTAVVLFEKVEVPNPNKPGETWTAFKILDELVSLKSNVSLEELVQIVVEKMEFWERQVGQKVRWKHWSDQSSFVHFKSSSDQTEHVLVYTASNGLIQLEAAAKGKGSIELGKKLLRKLLHQDRLFVSRIKCPQLTDTLRHLPLDRNGRVDRKSPFKHAFDALRYGISSELWAELEEEALLVTGKARPATGVFEVEL